MHTAGIRKWPERERMGARRIRWEIEREEEMKSRETATERQIEVLGIDVTIVQDCELVPDMIKTMAKKPLSMGKTPLLKWVH